MTRTREAAAVSRRLFYWCHTTSRQSFETGIQRVTRRLGRALSRRGVEVVPVGRHDDSGLIEVIGKGPDAFDAALAGFKDEPILLIPELTADLVARGADPACMAKAYGGIRTLSLVHDLIPLKLPEHYSSEAQYIFAKYYESFAWTDKVLATTNGVANELRCFLAGRALRVPPVAVVPLPAQFGSSARVNKTANVCRQGQPLKLVTVVSWERRKNLLRLLRALARVQLRVDIELAIVGRRYLDRGYDEEVEALLDTSSGVIVTGPIPDLALIRLITASDATVYPSLEEGFGLPIGESLWLGRPCVCHNASSMAEIAPGGGTLLIDMADEEAIASALFSMATKPELLRQLTEETLKRPLASWDDYAAFVIEVLAA